MTALTDRPAPLGDRIQARLHELGWSHQRLADSMGVTRVAVTKWTNHHRHPGRKRTALLAEKLGVPHEYLAD